MKQKIKLLLYDLRKLKAEAFKEEVRYSGGLESYTCYIKDSGISINLYAKELDLSFLNPNK